MKIHHLAFLLLCQFLFACNDPVQILASAPVKDSVQLANTANMVFKSTDGGQTWDGIPASDFDSQNKSGTSVSPHRSATADGVILATTQKGIVRSVDNGTSWDNVISEGGVGIAIESIKGGFAAITYSTASKTRRVRTSYDGGKTWQPIDAGLPPSPLISSIIQVGDDFFCGHPAGIYRSSDNGKTWKLLIPSVKNKVFNLSVSGNVIYAVPRAGGC